MAADSLIRRIAFSMIKGLNAGNAREILDATGSVDAFFELPQAELWMRLGSVNRDLSDAGRRRLLDAAASEAVFVEKQGITAVMVGDPGFPLRLENCNDAPALLYVRGNVEAVDCRRAIAVVGTRNATAYGVEMTRRLVQDIADKIGDVVIISGLAYGIDVNAHKAAMAAGLPTVAVVAHGLNTIYPADHRDVASRMLHSGGAVVTEYTSASPVHRGNFLARNRIVAGLSDAVIVVESDSRGGALSTARLALNYGRAVGAVPGRVTDRYSRGCNNLIATDAATVVRDAGDIASQLGWCLKAAPGQQTAFDFGILPPHQRMIVDHLRKHPSDTADDISRAFGNDFAAVSALLMEMEMDDVITANPGGTYSVNV